MKFGLNLYSVRNLVGTPEDFGPVEPAYAPVGDGTLLFDEIIPAMIESDTRHFLVEQDNAAYLPDTLGQVERSIKYLKANF